MHVKGWILNYFHFRDMSYIVFRIAMFVSLCGLNNTKFI